MKLRSKHAGVLTILLSLLSLTAFSQQNVVVIPMAGGNTSGGIAEFDGGDQSVTLTGTDTIYRTVVVQAPAGGKVIVNASGYVSAIGAQSTIGARCSITTGETIDSQALIYVQISNAASSETDSFAGTRGFDVPAGTNTFNLVCDSFLGTPRLSDSNLTAMYFPN